MLDLSNCIPADPDISGIGVRIAIYIQNLCILVLVLWALRDGRISVDELEVVRKQSITILITAFAIVISALVQAATFGLSAFHASIVLSLSWMNNTATFMYFLLHAHHIIDPQYKIAMSAHKSISWHEIIGSELGPPYRRMQAILPNRWVRETKNKTMESEPQPSFMDLAILSVGLQAAVFGGPKRNVPGNRDIHHEIHSEHASIPLELTDHPAVFDQVSLNDPQTMSEASFDQPSQSNSKDINKFWRVLMSGLHEKTLLISGSLHFLFMSILGMWVWSSPVRFEDVQQRRLVLRNESLGGVPDILPVYCTHVSIIGSSINMTSKALGVVSMVIYALSLTPLGLLVPMITLTWLFMMSSGRPRLLRLPTARTDVGVANDHSDHDQNHATLAGPSPVHTPRRDHPHDDMQSSGENDVLSLLPVTIGLVLLLLVNIVFVVDIETTIARARPVQANDEAKWTFGQTLAVLLLVLPLRDVLEYIGKSLIAEFRQKCTRNLQLAINKDVPDFAKACWEARWADNVDIYINERFPSALQCAAFCGNFDLVKTLLDHNADINSADRPGAHGLPLIAAASTSRGRKRVFGYLLKQPGIKWGRSNQDGKTVLHFAAEHGVESAVHYLLDCGANPNVQTNEGSMPIHLAACNFPSSTRSSTFRNYTQVVQLLLKHGAQVNEPDRDGLTALTYAVKYRKNSLVRTLLEHKANFKADSNRAWTSIMDAARFGDTDLIRLVIECDSIPDLSDEHGCNAFLRAARAGATAEVWLLLMNGSQVDQRGHAPNKDWTALMHAAHKGQESMVKLLLSHHANFNLEKEDGETALDIAQKRGYKEVAAVLEEAQKSSTLAQSTEVPGGEGALQETGEVSVPNDANVSQV